MLKLELRSELRQLQSLCVCDLQAQAKDFSEKDFANYLVNYFCYKMNRICAGFSRFGNKYAVYLRTENRVINRTESHKEFKNFKEAKEYLLTLITSND